MAKAKFDIPTQLPAGLTRPLYASVGATDRVVEVVRDYVADVQRRVGDVQKSVAAFDYQPQALRGRASDATKAVTARVESLNKTLTLDAQARRQLVEQRVGDLQAEALALPARLQKLVDEQVATAGDTYADLVKRGEVLVGRIRRQQSTQTAASSAKTTVAKAKTTKTQAKKSASTARKSPAKSSAKATATSAAETASSAGSAAAEAAKKVGD